MKFCYQKKVLNGFQVCRISFEFSLLNKIRIISNGFKLIWVWLTKIKKLIWFKFINSKNTLDQTWLFDLKLRRCISINIYHMYLYQTFEIQSNTKLLFRHVCEKWIFVFVYLVIYLYITTFHLAKKQNANISFQHKQSLHNSRSINCIIKSNFNVISTINI